MKNENENESVEILKQKAKYFYDNKITIHIKYKKGFWKRGQIKEIKKDYFVLNENLEGKIPIFFLEVKDIEKYSSNSDKIKKNDGKKEGEDER